jgi:hypothetical protein
LNEENSLSPLDLSSPEMPPPQLPDLHHPFSDPPNPSTLLLEKLKSPPNVKKNRKRQGKNEPELKRRKMTRSRPRPMLVRK